MHVEACKKKTAKTQGFGAGKERQASKTKY